MAANERQSTEGRTLLTPRKIEECKPQSVRRKKQVMLAETSRLAREACGFDFKMVYASKSSDRA